MLSHCTRRAFLSNTAAGVAAGLIIPGRALADTTPDFLALGTQQIIDYFTNAWTGMGRGEMGWMTPPREIAGIKQHLVRQANDIAAKRSATTGLVPYNYTHPIFTCKTETTTNAQSAGFSNNIAELFEYFGNEAWTAKGTLASIAVEQSRRFAASPAGINSWIDVTTGATRCSVSLILWPTTAALGLARMSMHLNDSNLASAANRILSWAIQPRNNPALKLLPPSLQPSGLLPTFSETCDSDTLYAVNQLFRISKIPGFEGWRSVAVGYASYFIDHAWLPSYGYCARKLYYSNGSPWATRLYDDAIDTTATAMINLYDATKAQIWHDRFRKQTETLLAINGDGWFPYAVKNGLKEPMSTDDPKLQTIHLKNLCQAYRVFGRPSWLWNIIPAFAKRLAADPSKWRTNGCDHGRAFHAVGQLVVENQTAAPSPSTETPTATPSPTPTSPTPSPTIPVPTGGTATCTPSGNTWTCTFTLNGCT